MPAQLKLSTYYQKIAVLLYVEEKAGGICLYI